MQHSSCVQVFQSLQELVHDILLMNFFKNVSTNHRVQIRVHELKHEVNISIIVSFEYVPELDDIFMIIQFLWSIIQLRCTGPQAVVCDL